MDREKSSRQCTRLLEVNPVPRTCVLGFGALPLAGLHNLRARTHVRGVLWYGVNIFDLLAVSKEYAHSVPEPLIYRVRYRHHGREKGLESKCKSVEENQSLTMCPSSFLTLTSCNLPGSVQPLKLGCHSQKETTESIIYEASDRLAFGVVNFRQGLLIGL